MTLVIELCIAEMAGIAAIFSRSRDDAAAANQQRHCSLCLGRNLAIEFAGGEGHGERLPALAAELVRHHVALIVAGGNQAAKAATSIISVIFTTGADPVQLGFVASLNRPGG